jgi:hypothetical protein
MLLLLLLMVFPSPSAPTPHARIPATTSCRCCGSIGAIHNSLINTHERLLFASLGKPQMERLKL